MNLYNIEKLLLLLIRKIENTIKPLEKQFVTAILD
jgi:hypothetical protein